MRGETELGQPNQPLTKPPLGNLPVSQLATGQLVISQLATKVANLQLARLPAYVGQVVNLRPIVNRPTATPTKLSRRSRQPCRHRIHLNIINNFLKLRLVTNQPIIALILPERPPGQSKHPIALASRKSLKRLHHSANFQQWCYQEMDVIRHHDVGVELIMPQLTKVDGICYHARDFRDAKVERACACVVENAVHSDERLAGGGCSREVAVRRKTAVQTPREEDRLADGMEVRKTAASEGSHLETVADPGKILRKVKRPIANRPQVTNLPHKAASSKAASSKAASSQQAQQPARNAASMQSSQQHTSQQTQQPAGAAGSFQQAKQPAGNAAGSQSRCQQWSVQVNAA
jgi:hypothetical protein